MADNNTSDETKYKNTVWLKQSTIDAVREIYKKDDCRSKSEFIERAIMFYVGFISSNYNPTYLPTIITSTIKSIVRDSNKQLERVIFKLAVEVGVQTHLLTAMSDLDDSALFKLRSSVTDEVRRINGIINFEQAVREQRGW